ncbi:MAG: hypothetical protein HY261_06220 [Chloroflexi bacterium]|nr:hypothetical protein [Chloroflexota bacterium]
MTYNIAIATVAGMAASGALCLGYNVVASMHGGNGQRPRVGTALVFGLVAVLFLLFIGNLVGTLEYFHANGIGSHTFWGWLKIDGLTGHGSSRHWYPSEGGWWWWRSTRVISTLGPNGQTIDYTITEFPFFSLLLGDLHPHVMSLPFVMLAIGVAFAALRSPSVCGLALSGPMLWSKDWEAHPIARAIAWGPRAVWEAVRSRFWLVLLTVITRLRGEDVRFLRLAACCVAFLVAEFLLFSPFYLDLHTRTAILTVRRVQTRQIHYFLVLGPFLMLSLSLLAALSWQNFGREVVRRLAARLAGPEQMQGVPTIPGRSGAAPSSLRARYSGLTTNGQLALWAILLPLVPWALWAVIELGSGVHDGALGDSVLAVGSRFWHLLPLFVILSLALGVLFRLVTPIREQSAALQFTVLLVVFAFLLTMGAELFHIWDVFNDSPELRMNTVFKFYYQAWALFSIVGAASLYWWWSHRPARGANGRYVWASTMAFFAVFIGAGFVYVPPAIASMTSNFEPKATLNALADFLRASPQEYEAAQWLKSRSGASVIVEAWREAAGGSDYLPEVSRMSRISGLPTVLGWPGHEKQWRDDSQSEIDRRASDVDTIYQGNVQQAQALLKQYGVTYVVVGDLERQTYGAAVLNRFDGTLDIAFKNERVVIYKAPAASTR